MSEENKKKNPEEFYKGFKEKLDDAHDFPEKFMFKFILPTNHKKIAEVQRVFDGAHPQFHMKESKTGKYTSITVVIFALDSDQVIHYFKEVGKIEEVIMI